MQRRSSRGRPPRDLTPVEAALGPAVTLPVVLVSEAAVLPHISATLPISDARADAAVNRALGRDRRVLVLVERNAEEATHAWIDRFVQHGEFDDDDDESETEGEPPASWSERSAPGVRSTIGVVAELVQPIRRHGQSFYVVQGLHRGIVESTVRESPYVLAWVREQTDPEARSAEAEATMSAVVALVERYISVLPNMPDEIMDIIRGVDEPGHLADLLASSPDYTAAQRDEIIGILAHPVRVEPGDPLTITRIAGQVNVVGEQVRVEGIEIGDERRSGCPREGPCIDHGLPLLGVGNEMLIA